MQDVSFEVERVYQLNKLALEAGRLAAYAQELAEAAERAKGTNNFGLESAARAAMAAVVECVGYVHTIQTFSDLSKGA